MATPRCERAAQPNVPTGPPLLCNLDALWRDRARRSKLNDPAPRDPEPTASPLNATALSRAPPRRTSIWPGEIQREPIPSRPVDRGPQRPPIICETKAKLLNTCYFEQKQWSFGVVKGSPPMTILIAGHFIYTGRVGGAEQMVYNLTRGLSELGAQVGFLCADRGNLSPEFLEESRAAGRPIVECGGGGARFISEQRACLDGRLRGEAILFPQYYIPPIVPRRLGRAAVVIHDFQYRHFPQYFSARKRAWLRLSHRRAFAKAEKVIVISEFVRQEALQFYGRRAEHASVIPNPISWERLQSVPGPHPFGERPYVLSVAAHWPHKRLDVLVRAFARLIRKRPDLLLVLCGQLPEKLVSLGKDAIGLRRLIADLGLADRIRITGYLADHEVGNLYNHAAAFAFPSIFEGFGMPAVEALGFGLPTLTTRCTALPEATLGLAEFVDDPADVDEWADRLVTLVDAPRLSTKIVDRVREHYSIRSIGRRYLKALKGESHRSSITDAFQPQLLGREET